MVLNGRWGGCFETQRRTNDKTVRWGERILKSRARKKLRRAIRGEGGGPPSFQKSPPTSAGRGTIPSMLNGGLVGGAE